MEKLPNREHAFVPLSKLDAYLLSDTHPIGRLKSGFFHAIGFDKNKIDQLAEQLLLIARSEDVTDKVTTAYGTKYVVDGSIQTPLGITVPLRTVWIIERDEKRPRFITAYPV